MILNMNINISIFILTCASWLPRLIIYGSELVWDVGFDLGLSVVMVLGAPIGYPRGYSINILIGLALFNYFFVVSIFGCSLTWNTGCLDDWHWRSIFGWIIIGTSTWIPT